MKKTPIEYSKDALYIVQFLRAVWGDLFLIIYRVSSTLPSLDIHVVSNL